MSSVDWFSRKLGATGGAPAAPPAPPPTSAPAAPAPVPANPEDVNPGEPGSFTYALHKGETQGGEAHRQGKVGVCPGCGSGNYLELRNGHSCFDCGYPLIQYGSELGEGGQA